MNKCSICGKEEKYLKRSYCGKHYRQYQRYGKILLRTRKDPNEYVEKKNCYEIQLYNAKSEKIAKTLIDKECYVKASKYKWYLINGYVVSDSNKTRKLYLHQLILGKKKGLVIDHISNDPLDNRKKNLRHCTIRQNIIRSPKVKGHYLDKKRNKWFALIRVNYKQIFLGYFANKEEALKARIKAEKKYFRKFAPKR